MQVLHQHPTHVITVIRPANRHKFIIMRVAENHYMSYWMSASTGDQEPVSTTGYSVNLTWSLADFLQQTQTHCFPPAPEAELSPTQETHQSVSSMRVYSVGAKASTQRILIRRFCARTGCHHSTSSSQTSHGQNPHGKSLFASF